MLRPVISEDVLCAKIAMWFSSRNRNTIEFLGIWEQLFNPSFNPLEFEGFRKEAGLNAFTMSPSRWIEATNAKGLVAMAGRYGGTYARTDIAFEFASWISVEFKLYLVKEFQRLKEEEQKLIGWSVKRELSKLNYRIHVKDYVCEHCKSQYELKSKRSDSESFQATVADGVYRTMIGRITSLDNPSFFFMHYDRYEVNNLVIVPKCFFTPSVIEKRDALAATARRGGMGRDVEIINDPLI